MTAVIIPTLDPDSAMCRNAVAAVEATAPHVEIILEHDTERAGFAETCNAAACRTTADRLIFLNDDTLAADGWADALLAHVTDTTIAGARLVYPDGAPQHTGVFLRRRGVLEAYNRTTEAPSGEVPAVTGACLAIARPLWDRLGGFDETFVNGYEDVDLCLRARQTGATVRYVAEATVVHLESRSPGRFDHVRHNVALLNERWGHLPI